MRPYLKNLKEGREERGEGKKEKRCKRCGGGLLLCSPWTVGNFSTFLWLSEGQTLLQLEDWATTGWVGRREVAKVVMPTILSPGNFCLQEKPVLLHHSWWFALLLDHFPSRSFSSLTCKGWNSSGFHLQLQSLQMITVIPAAGFHPCPQPHGVSSLLSSSCSSAQPCPLKGSLGAAQTHPVKLWTMFLLFPDLFLVSTILYNALHVPQTYPASVLSFLKSTQFFVFWPLTCKLL